jgi:hypothetical protein
MTGLTRSGSSHPHMLWSEVGPAGLCGPGYSRLSGAVAQPLSRLSSKLYREAS